MKLLACVIATLPTLAVAGSLDSINSDVVAAATGIRLDQIIDGAKALQALKGRDSLFNTDAYKPFLLVTGDEQEQIKTIQCSDAKAFSVNADEPEISGTHTEFDVIHISFARCEEGPLSDGQIKATAQASRAR